MPDIVFYMLGLVVLLATPQPEEALFIYDLRAPAISMPREMAEGAFNVIACESKWDTNAIGKAGEKGLLQIHPIHARNMGYMAFGNEQARFEYAVSLWKVGGWNAWSCTPSYFIEPVRLTWEGVTYAK